MERTFSRAAGSRLQPVEIAKRLARIMDAEQVVSVLGVRVPNIFDVELSPVDFAQFKPIRGSVANEMETYLARVARERLFVLASPPIVRLHCREDLKPGDFMVRAQMEDVGPVSVGDRAAASVASQHTRVMTVPAASERAPRRHVAQLVAPDRSYSIESVPSQVGRNADNGIVVDDRRVSRHHAEVTQVNGRWLVRDLGSTNGTAVNGRLVREAPLTDGDRVSFGGFEVIFQE